MNKFFGSAIAAVILTIGTQQTVLAAGASQDQALVFAAFTTFFTVVVAASAAADAVVAVAFIALAVAAASTAVAFATIEVAPLDVVAVAVAFSSVVTIISFGSFVSYASAPVLEEKIAKHLVIATFCLEAATIGVTFWLGTSLIGPLIALIGIAALGSLWLVARRQQAKQIVPAV